MDHWLITIFQRTWSSTPSAGREGHPLGRWRGHAGTGQETTLKIWDTASPTQVKVRGHFRLGNRPRGAGHKKKTNFEKKAHSPQSLSRSHGKGGPGDLKPKARQNTCHWRESVFPIRPRTLAKPNVGGSIFARQTGERLTNHIKLRKNNGSTFKLTVN